MAVKVLINTLGQQVISDVKQVENKVSKEVVGYWLSNPRLVFYNQGEDGEVGVNFTPFCLISNEAEFSVRADYVVTILEPRPEVVEAWERQVFGEPGPTEDTVLSDLTPPNPPEDVTNDNVDSTVPVEAGDDASSAV